MSYFIKISDVDVSPLNSQLDLHPELWGAFSWRKSLKVHSEMTDIWVRYNAIENLGPKFNDEHEAVWYPAYEALPALKGIIDPLLEIVEGTRLGGVLITRIPPGCGIARHVDRGWHVETFDKFYVSLKSSPGSKFICHEGEEEVLEPKAGECWRFDNRLPHSVRNDSPDDRVTLIVCIETEKYKHGLDDRRGTGMDSMERYESIAA